MYRISCYLTKEKPDIRMGYEKTIIECGEEENLIEDYDVLIDVKCAVAKRKRITHVLLKLFKDYIARDPSGIGATGIGSVIRIGAKVNDITKGQLVIFLLPESSEQSAVGMVCIAPRYACFPCPYNVDLVEAVATVEALIPTYTALQNRPSRGDTVLLTQGHTPAGQMIIQSLYQRGCKIVVFVSQPDHMDIIGQFRNMVDSIFQAWNYRVPRDCEERLMKECDKLGYSMIIDLATDNPLYKERLGHTEYSPITHNHAMPLKLSSALAILGIGGHLVLGYAEGCTITKEMTANLHAKGGSLHFMNPSANLLAPNKLGSLINYLNVGLTALENKSIRPPLGLERLYLEKAIDLLNNDTHPMEGCYVVDMEMVNNRQS